MQNASSQTGSLFELEVREVLSGLRGAHQINHIDLEDLGFRGLGFQVHGENLISKFCGHSSRCSVLQ